MNRRSFFGALAALPVVGKYLAAKPPVPARYIRECVSCLPDSVYNSVDSDLLKTKPEVLEYADFITASTAAEYEGRPK